MYLLGYDIGSSSVKASLLNVEKNQVKCVVQYPDNEMDIISRKHGWAEQQPELWWQNFIIVTRKLLAESKVPASQIKGIGISYQMHGLVLVDKDYQVLRPSIIWCDSRGVEIGKSAFKEMGREYCLQNLLNSPGNFTASRLKWVKDNEPNIYQRVHKFMLPGDFISLKLTGEAYTTIPGLSEGIFWDFNEQKVSSELLNYYGLSEEHICDITPTFGIQGQVTKEAAALCGLKAGTPVSYRAGDQPTNALALNVMRPNEIAATSGTSGVVYGVVDKPIFDYKSRVNSFAHVNYEQNHDRIGVLLCLNGAGIQYSWMKNQIARGDRNYKDMERMVSTVPIGCDGLCILPFGNGAERMLENQNINSHIHNIQFNRHDRAHLYRAALEGVAFSFVRGVNILKEIGLKVDVMRVGNDNMFQSEVFSTTIATLLDCQIEVMDTTAAVGAARAAGVATGVYSSLEQALEGVSADVVYEPEYDGAACHRAYNYWQSCLDKALMHNAARPANLNLREALEDMELKMEEKSKELTALHLKIQARDEFLEELKNDIRDLQSENGFDHSYQLDRILKKIDNQMDRSNRWQSFEQHFDVIHGDFFKNLKSSFPGLSVSDVKLMALLKMRMNTKDIAEQLNLSVRGVETRRYRLRKKLQLDRHLALDNFVEQI
ncbi:FGGY family carbohydrate kinase [Fulvivirga ligni]|uniref:FGGY family carbohydrate kinase n=1 Tax=Fulvivirga ligni TaxID=2904246 RepID=UPI001EFF4F6C|nr:FGGY family carbohydrate kinase [Fulvivirga ligni]UII23846.1 carbohydrate kinase [Fulvivirga ligni]